MNQFIVMVVLFFFSCPVLAIAEKKTTKTEIVADELEEVDFTPSLSETLNNTNRLKSQLKRQLAEELNDDSIPVTKRKSKRSVSQTVKSEIALFGDFEVSISERDEEDLVEVKEQEKKK